MKKEQWKSGGDCSKCRKLKYCTKDCTEHRKYIRRRVVELVGRLITDSMIKGGNK